MHNGQQHVATQSFTQVSWGAAQRRGATRELYQCAQLYSSHLKAVFGTNAATLLAVEQALAREAEEEEQAVGAAIAFAQLLDELAVVVAGAESEAQACIRSVNENSSRYAVSLL